MIETSEWEGVHRSLNFTTLRKLERFLLQNNIRYLANKSALQNMVMRGAFDQELKNRHKLLASGIGVLFKLRLIRVTSLLPQRFWPIIDIEIFN